MRTLVLKGEVQKEEPRVRSWSLGNSRQIPKAADNAEISGSRQGSRSCAGSPRTVARSRTSGGTGGGFPLRDCQGKLQTLVPRQGSQKRISLVSAVGLVVFKKLHAADMAKVGVPHHQDKGQDNVEDDLSDSDDDDEDV